MVLFQRSALDCSRKEVIRRCGLLGYLRLRSFYDIEAGHGICIPTKAERAFEKLDLENKVIFLKRMKSDITAFGDEQSSHLDSSTLLTLVTSEDESLRSYALKTLLFRKISAQKTEVSLTREEKLLLLTDYDFQRQYSYDLDGSYDGREKWKRDDSFKSLRLEVYEQIKPTLTPKEIDKVMGINRDKEVLLDLLDDPRAPKSAFLRATYNPYFEVDEKAFNVVEDVLTPEDVRLLADKPIRLINRITSHPQTPRDVLFRYATKGYLNAFKRIERTLDADELEDISKKCWMYTSEMKAIRERVISHENTVPRTIAQIFTRYFETGQETIGYEEKEEESYLGNRFSFEVPITQQVYTDSDIQRAHNLIKNRNREYKKKIIFEVRKLERESKMAKGLELLLE